MNVIEAFTRQAMIRPQSPALLLGERTITYGAMARHVSQLAESLRQLGVARGDVVAIVAPQFAQHIGLTLAVAQLGATSLPLPASAREGENEAIAQMCNAAWLVHNQPGAFRVDAPCIRQQVSLKSLNTGPHASTPPVAQTEPGDIWRIGLSSGTTGRPKPIAFSHASAVLRSQLMLALFPSAPEERVMVFMGASLQFSVGYWMRTLSAGGALVAGDRDPHAAMEALREQRVTFLLTSPGNAIALAKVAMAPGSPYADPPPALKTLCVGGSTVAPAMRRNFTRHLCPNLVINYGTSELGLVALFDTAMQERKPGSAGRVVPWVDLQALDDEGKPLPAGKRGRLRMRSPLMASGYVGADPETASAFRDGWFHSTDIGAVAADGTVHLAGREGDVLNLSGVKVDPAQVEEAICSDPAVIECAALAAPAKSGRMALVAAVVAPQPVDKEALKKRCHDRLGAALVPKGVFQLPSLPRNEAGKVMRNQVLDMIRQLQHAETPPGAA